jgi:CheY-like chemotaxis protein
VVGSVADGLAAIEAADALQPEACVLDLHMPLLDGVSAAARLRRDHPSICLIALTGDADGELHRAVEEAGADAVLLKDEMMDALVERLQTFRARAAGER